MNQFILAIEAYFLSVKVPGNRVVKKHLLILNLLVFLFLPTTHAYQGIILNKPLSETDPRYEYTYQLMSMIIQATPEFGEATINSAASYMTRDRTLHELIKGESINVMAEAPKKNWNNNLLVVPIPIRKGLQGFRVFIIKSKTQTAIAKVNSLEELKTFSTGSGAHWSTKKVLEDSGFSVVTGSNYEGLFDMLVKERFFTFSRGINEAYKEVTLHKNKHPQLKVENSLLLYLPLPTYFYVSPTSPKLAERIKTGLLRLITDGSFDQFFFKQHCEDLLKSKISQRKVFNIPNDAVSKYRMLSLVKQDFLLDPKTNFQYICQKYQ